LLFRSKFGIGDHKVFEKLVNKKFSSAKLRCTKFILLFLPFFKIPRPPWPDLFAPPLGLGEGEGENSDQRGGAR
jgi:hypothetical protein